MDSLVCFDAFLIQKALNKAVEEAVEKILNNRFAAFDCERSGMKEDDELTDDEVDFPEF